MPKQTKVFLLLLLLVTAAGALALFVRDWNTRITKPFVTPQTEQNAPGTTAPAMVVIYAPTTTNQISNEYVSRDGVTSAVLESPSTPLPNPFVFHGTTTAFESQASWKLTQGNGKIIGSGYFSVASPDAGIPGPFRVTGFYDVVPTLTTGTLTIYEASAKDGEPIHVVDIPVSLERATSTVRAFFGNSSKGSDDDCALTFGLVHTIVHTNDGLSVAMHELLKGPTPYEKNKGYTTALPEYTNLPTIQNSNGSIAVDFNYSFQQGVAGSCRVQAIRSQIEKTLTQWDKDAKVKITVDGKSEEVLQP